MDLCHSCPPIHSLFMTVTHLLTLYTQCLIQWLWVLWLPLVYDASMAKIVLHPLSHKFSYHDYWIDNSLSCTAYSPLWALLRSSPLHPSPFTLPPTLAPPATTTPATLIPPAHASPHVPLLSGALAPLMSPRHPPLPLSFFSLLLSPFHRTTPPPLS